MYQITLVSMPFASLCFPSIGLTQLKRVVDEEFKGRVSVDVKYINHEFGRFIGTRRYQSIANSSEHHNSGLGDWFFRDEAFPGLEDNTEEYFHTFYPQDDEGARLFRRALQDRRQRLRGFLDHIVEKHKLYQSDLVGFASMFSQNAASIALARRIKELNPGVVVVMGGANCESPMGQELARNVETTDFVFSGPALKSFPKFVGHCLESEMEACHRINGVFSSVNVTAPIPAEDVLSAHLTGAGLVSLTGLRQPNFTSEVEQPLVGAIGEEADINTRIPLDYTPFLDSFEEHFRGASSSDDFIEPALLFETSRGCWWGEKAHCTFCGLNGSTMAYRSMDPELAVELINSLFEYSSRCKRFFCVDNILPKNYIADVFPKVRTPEDASIFYEVKADLSEEEIRVLSEARVLSIQPGIESLATSTLKLMRKGTSSFQNLMFLQHCATYNVQPQWNLLIGFPGEGEDVYRKYVADLPQLVHLTPPSGCFPVRFDRYSPYFVQADKYGLDLRPVDYYRFIYPFGDDVLRNMAYYFADCTPAPRYRAEMLKWFNALREVTDGWREKWYAKGRALKPHLFFKERGEETVIYDSRSGEAIQHTISRGGALLLALMRRPRRLADLERAFDGSPQEAARELASLQERGLVFQEGDRFLSLVMEADPRGALSTGSREANE